MWHTHPFRALPAPACLLPRLLVALLRLTSFGQNQPILLTQNRVFHSATTMRTPFGGRKDRPRSADRIAAKLPEKLHGAAPRFAHYPRSPAKACAANSSRGNPPHASIGDKRRKRGRTHRRLWTVPTDLQGLLR